MDIGRARFFITPGHIYPQTPTTLEKILIGNEWGGVKYTEGTTEYVQVAALTQN